MASRGERRFLIVQFALVLIIGVPVAVVSISNLASGDSVGVSVGMLLLVSGGIVALTWALRRAS